MGRSRIITGDCVEAMTAMDEASVDAIVTDPPYGLEFMGKDWDQLAGVVDAEGWNQGESNPYSRARIRSGQGASYGLAPAGSAMQEWHQAWATEAFRVLKPGGHLLAFGGTRTYHRLTCAIEDAGFEIRDCLAWLYGSGFPKSLSLYRSTLSKLCRSTEHARRAVRISGWHPAESNGAKAPIALALAETVPEGELALLIQTGGAGASCEGMAMSSSVLAEIGTSLSTESSWRESSSVRLNGESRSITETVIALTTDPRILNSWRSLNTPPIITPDEFRADGCRCDVWPAVESLNGDGSKWSDIPLLIAPEPAIGRVAPLEPLGTALNPPTNPSS